MFGSYEDCFLLYRKPIVAVLLQTKAEYLAYQCDIFQRKTEYLARNSRLLFKNAAAVHSPGEVLKKCEGIELDPQGNIILLLSSVQVTGLKAAQESRTNAQVDIDRIWIRTAICFPYFHTSTEYFNYPVKVPAQ